MTRFTSNVLAACAALALTFGSIGAIVTVPPAQAAAYASLAQPLITLPVIA